MILDEETAQTVIYALATGYRDRAASLLFEKADLPEPAREEAVALIMNAPDTSTAARLFGDWARSHGAERSIVNEAYRTAFYTGSWWKEQTASPMMRFFTGNKAGRPLDKWPHYFGIYEQFLSRFVGTDVRVLEIGVFRGGGLDLLSDYLGPQARLVGMDIDETARDLADPRFPVFLGDQSDPADLQRLNDEYGPFDVIIDDGGHTVNQQIVSADVLFPELADGGVYLIEDVHTSYWPDYLDVGDRTLLDWVRERLDDLNAHHFSTERELTHWQQHLRSVNVYDSVVVLEKGLRFAPFSEISGTKEFAQPQRERQLIDVELVATRDAAIAQRDAAVAARDGAVQDAAASAQQVAAAKAAERASQAELDAVREDLQRAVGLLDDLRSSRSWRITAPLRRAAEKGRE